MGRADRLHGAWRLAGLYVDTIRHMRASQLVGRSRRLVPPALLAGGLVSGRSESFAAHAAGLGADPAPQSGPVPDPADTGTFEAFGYARTADGEELWKTGSEGLLFMFHLHGFCPLGAYAAGEHSAAHDAFWAEIIESWLRTHNRPSLPSWHPYPTSLRLIAWCSALGAVDSWRESLRGRLAGEIARQGRYLRRAVEHDIGGNHVLKNATALIYAGITVPNSGLLEPGLALLRRSLARQILADGAHEERSTSYHREIEHDLAGLLMLLERTGWPVPDWLSDARGRMAGWQAALAGPDGDLPMLGDAWDGPAIDPGVSSELTVLRASGHVVLRCGDDQVVFDCGNLCPAHLPAHAHADALSFVLWVDGQPLIVDRGAFAYTGAQRGAFRATAAHSTVEVDGEDQCVFWGDFRASFLPRIETPRVRSEDGIIVVESSHDGYRRLPDPVVHHRALLWVPGSGMVVVDRLRCRRRHDIATRLQLAPSTAAPLGISPLVGEAMTEVVEHAPFFGARVDAAAVLTRLTVRTGEAFGWTLLRPEASARLTADGTVDVLRGSRTSRVRLRPIL